MYRIMDGLGWGGAEGGIKECSQPESWEDISVPMPPAPHQQVSYIMYTRIELQEMCL